MRRFTKQLLSLGTGFCLVIGNAGIVSAAEGGFGNFQPMDEEAAPINEGLAVSEYGGEMQWRYQTDEESGAGYYALDVIYCANPTIVGGEAIQQLVVYAPESYMQQNENGTPELNPDGAVTSSTGVVYTTENAPIIYNNTSGGYSASNIEAADMALLQEGYVLVSIRTRGKETKDDEEKYIGQFPALMTDMKAGVRYLKANDDVLPGNSERIVSRGYSSGGAVSAMLGASGNSTAFESYLEEIGAADASDDIFIALASAPITNLSSADASYEWYQAANQSYWLFSAMAFDREGNDISEVFPVGRENVYPLGSNMLGGSHEDELSALLYDWYVDYIQGMGFDLGDDGRSGEFYDGFVQIYSDALTEFIARYDELKGLIRGEAPETAEEYLNSIQSEDGWFTYDSESGIVTIDSLDGLMTNFVGRNKMCPSLDSYNYKSNENNAFTDADGNTVHFSSTVENALGTLLEEAKAGEHEDWTEEDVAYLETLYEDYAAGINEESTHMLEVMSPINYIVGQEGFDGTIAPYWRLRVGSADGDHGAPAAWLLAQGLEKYTDADVSVGIAWAMGHSLAELTNQDLYDYIAGIMTEVDGL